MPSCSLLSAALLPPLRRSPLTQQCLASFALTLPQPCAMHCLPTLPWASWLRLHRLLQGHLSPPQASQSQGTRPTPPLRALCGVTTCSTVDEDGEEPAEEHNPTFPQLLALIFQQLKNTILVEALEAVAGLVLGKYICF